MLTEFLTGPGGHQSSTRLMAFMSLCAAIFFGFIVVSGKGSPNGDVLVFSFLGAAFGGNVANKIVEKKDVPG